MPLFSNTAISVFDEKFPGSGLVFDSLSLDIRCYKTVQVLEREASNSSPSQFLSLSLSLFLLPFPSNKNPLTTPSPPGQATYILIIGTTSPTNPPETPSFNDYEQQQQHDDLISKILSPPSSLPQNKKNPIPTSSSSSSSWLRTEHYKLTTAKKQDFQYVESTSTRNEELREKGISQNLSIVSFDFSLLSARECVRRKEKERKRKERRKNGKEKEKEKTK